MNKFYLKQLLCMLTVLCLSFSGYSQCVIDSSQTTPGLHPDSLINGEVNQFYSQDITFVMIEDTLGLNISNFFLQGINGLPVGMLWTCNNASSGCNYDPAVSLYGCVRIYGTPLLPGTYPLSVTVVATVALIGNQTFNFNTNLIIDPATTSNNGFSMINSIGCAPLTVGFVNNLTPQQVIKWKFGNGDSSMVQQPNAVTYTQPGDYIVTQSATQDTIGAYYLSSIKVDSIPNAAGFLDTPDMYILVKNQSGVTVFDSHPSVSNTNPPLTFSIPSLQLSNQTYLVEVWDEDSGLTAPDDYLGSVTFQGHGSSGFAVSTLTGIAGRLRVNFNISFVPSPTSFAVDTVHVYPGVTQPTVSLSGNPAFCDGDTLFAISSDSSFNQWFKDGNLMVSETGQTLAVTSSGNYFVVLSNSFGCNDTSAQFTATALLPPPYPNFLVNGNTLTSSIVGNYSYQWYLNDSILPNDTAITYIATVSGDYRLALTDSSGCSRISFPIPVIVTGIRNVSSSIELSIYPNPAQKVLFLTNIAKASQLEILNAIGKKMFSENVNTGSIQVDVANWPRGIYFVHGSDGNKQNIQKIVLD